MNKTTEKVTEVLSVLPKKTSEEISRILNSRRGGGELSEIRIRAAGRSSVICGGEYIPLFTTLCPEDLKEVVDKLTEGSLYAKRDIMASGYLLMNEGIRIGICGCARYDGGELVGVSEPSSLVFRIPTGSCAFADELFSIFREGVGAGLMIYSPPGVGKTTALRALAGYIGGELSKRVCIVDERCEFSVGDYEKCEVDVLRGYKRRAGIEIATRTLSPDVIIIDEIGADDAEGIAEVARSGIPLIASAHAGSYSELLSRQSLRPLFACSAFDVFVGISRESGEYSLEVNRK